MDSLDFTIQRAVASYRPSDVLLDKIRGRILPVRPAFTVIALHSDCAAILDRVFREQEKRTKKVWKRIFHPSHP